MIRPFTSRAIRTPTEGRRIRRARSFLLAEFLVALTGWIAVAVTSAAIVAIAPELGEWSGRNAMPNWIGVAYAVLALTAISITWSAATGLMRIVLGVRMPWSVREGTARTPPLGDRSD